MNFIANMMVMAKARKNLRKAVDNLSLWLKQEKMSSVEIDERLKSLSQEIKRTKSPNNMYLLADKLEKFTLYCKKKAEEKNEL